MGLAVLSTSPPRISRNDACTVVSVVPYRLSRRGIRVVAQPSAKTLWFQRFAGEHHSLKLELTPSSGAAGGGLQRVKRRGGLA